jgi:MFS superfamily sulfate permease-like transporter
MATQAAQLPKDVSRRRTGLAGWAPGVAALRTYRREWLPRDLTAGLVLSALLVPQGMAYAELAGLPAITGLYATVVCLVAYAAVGPSPLLVLGPDSALGAMIAAVVLPLAAGNQEQAVALAGTLALLVGLVCVSAGALRLGFVADLLSRPIRVGYLAGLAVTIVVGQLPKLLGFSVDADGLLQELAATWQSRDQINPYALAIGLVDLALIRD